MARSRRVLDRKNPVQTQYTYTYSPVQPMVLYDVQQLHISLPAHTLNIYVQGRGGARKIHVCSCAYDFLPWYAFRRRP